MKSEIKGDTLVLTIDISKAALEAAPLSKTGKSKVVATTSGFCSYMTPNGAVKLSLNCIR